jgi:hypothetical protein
MKRFLILNSILFLLFCVSRFVFQLFVGVSTNFTCRVLNFTYGSVATWGNSYERSIDYNLWKTIKTKKRKGVILGSSCAYRNINTQILEDKTDINWFNLGSSSQTPQVSCIILKEIVKTNIDFVLLDLYCGLLLGDNNESIYDLINNSDFSLREKFNLFLLAPNPILLDRLIFRKVEKLTSRKISRLPTMNNGTYLKNGTTFSPQQDCSLYPHEQKWREVTILKTQGIQEIIDYCSEKGITLIINITPILNYKQKNNLQFPTVISNDDFNDNKELFYDSHHMTGKGAIFYSECLGNKIRILMQSKSM